MMTRSRSPRIDTGSSYTPCEAYETRERNVTIKTRLLSNLEQKILDRWQAPISAVKWLEIRRLLTTKGPGTLLESLAWILMACAPGRNVGEPDRECQWEAQAGLEVSAQHSETRRRYEST